VKSDAHLAMPSIELGLMQSGEYPGAANVVLHCQNQQPEEQFADCTGLDASIGLSSS
jgi:hypothetical protein